MVFLTISQFNIIWLDLKLEKNEWKLTVDYSNIYIVVFPMKVLIFNIIEIFDSIQSYASKHFKVIDLANTFYSVLILTAPWLQFGCKFKETQFTFIWLPMEYFTRSAISHSLFRK